MSAGRVELPGGLIAETPGWRAEHCLGSFGVGAVVVKTKEHREDLWQITAAEAAELGPFLGRVAEAIVTGLGAARAYVTMWVDKPPHHVHLVVYPRWPSDEKRALDLQNALAQAGAPSADAAAIAAERLRAYLSDRP